MIRTKNASLLMMGAQARDQGGGRIGVEYLHVAGGDHEAVGSNFYQNIHDRSSGERQIPPPDQIIDERARERDLGAS